MKAGFNEEHNRGKKVYHAVTGLAQHCEPIAQIASGVAQTLVDADALVAEAFDHDKKGVQLDLREEHITQRFIDLRSSAHHMVWGMLDEGPNSDLLPQMDYKRAVDRNSSSSSGGSDEAPPGAPASGSAPNNN